MYRASEDDFGFQPFIDKCKGKAPTLCIVQTQKERIFGGFTDIPW